MITTFNQHVIIALNLVRKLCHGRLYKLRNGLEEPLLCEEKERGKQRLPRLLTPVSPAYRKRDRQPFLSPRHHLGVSTLPSMPSGPGAVANARARLKNNPPGPRGVMSPPIPSNRAPVTPVFPARPRLLVPPPTFLPRATGPSVVPRQPQLITIQPGPRVYAFEQPSPAKPPKTARWTAPVVAAYHNRPDPTSSQDVYDACDLICSLDPRVKGKRAAHDVNHTGIGVTVSIRDQVLRRWEMSKLVKHLPLHIICDIVGLKPATFQHREPSDIAKFIFAKASRFSDATIRQSRYSLLRLQKYMLARGMSWDGPFSQLPELDLFAFLMTVHLEATANGTDKRPGHAAVWGAFGGLQFLVLNFKLLLPTAAVRCALPTHNTNGGAHTLLSGALPLPPEALQLICDYAANPATPPVMASWAFALAFSTLSSLRQANTQRLCFYGFLRVGNREYLLSQHTDGKSRTKTPTLCITPLQDMRDSRAWFDRGQSLLWADGDFLWADCSGDPLLATSSLVRCPLSDEKIQGAMRLVLQHACGMSPAMTLAYTKHSARKTMVSTAQSAGSPWEICIELGHWNGASLDQSFLLPSETVRRKKALEIMAMPRRYSANARISRVAQIVGNQVMRMKAYLLLPQVKNRCPSDWNTKWNLMRPYDKNREGA